MKERIYSEIVVGVVTICQLIKKYFINACGENSGLYSFKPFCFVLFCLLSVCFLKREKVWSWIGGEMGGSGKSCVWGRGYDRCLLL